MAGINNSVLYPPIVNTYMPAFLADTSCKVYFSISAYNSFKDIRCAMITVTHQSSNLSALDDNEYVNGIKFVEVCEDSSISTDNRYYIEIYPKDLGLDSFNLNEYYKVQIRFSRIAAETPPEDPEKKNISLPTATWLVNNAEFFSEWSSICLIRGISEPTLVLKNIEADLTSNSSLFLSSANCDVIGTLKFSSEIETDNLKNYIIKLYDENDNLILTTDTLYASNYSKINEINYHFNYAFQDGQSYKVVILLTTRCGYSMIVKYKFTIIEQTKNKTNLNIFANIDNENGRAEITLKAKTTDPLYENIIIRRSSSKNNFTTWEDIYTFSIIDKDHKDIIWYDYTIENGIWYKYAVQTINFYNIRTMAEIIDEPVMTTFEDLFLVADGEQIKIKFDPSVSSFKHVIAESTTNTIGSQYAFITRNGYMNYRQFPLSGLISFHMDEDKLFTSRKNEYGDNLSLYNQYNEENNITKYNDYIYEKDFRNKVINFLYKDNVKLFRSPTAGNILVKLTDISFTPKQELSNYVYSFSCTATEIDDNIIENYNRYFIQDFGKKELEEIKTQIEILGSENGIFGREDFVKETLDNKYKYSAPSGYISKTEYLNYLKLNILTEPYSIYEDIDGPHKYNGEPYEGILTSGYIVEINNTKVIINNEGILELKDKNTKIEHLSFPVELECEITYNVILSQTEDISKEFKVISYMLNVGQLWDSFYPCQSLEPIIRMKYYENYSTYYQDLVSIEGVQIEAKPHTILYIKEFLDDDYERVEMNDTGLLTFYEDNTLIEDIYACGVQLYEATESELNRNEVHDEFFIDTGITARVIDDIKNPIKNGVYILEDIDYIRDYYQNLNNQKLNEILKDTTKVIYYNSTWYPFTNENIALVKTDVLLDYICEVMKGVY